MTISPLSQPGNNAIKPEKPTSVSASATVGGNATVSFAASTNPGKGTANYVATSSPGNITGSASSSPISITGLTNGTAYTFTVVKQSGSSITSDNSDASGSITAYSAPIFGTQSGSSSPTAPTTVSTTSVSSVSTTSAYLTSSMGTGATFYGYKDVDNQTTTYAGTSTGGGSNQYQLTSLAEKTTYNYRVVVTNTNSAQSLITRVTPNGSTTTVSVEYGNTTSYGNNASVTSGNANIGSGTSEVATTWSLGSSGNATIYYRVTATYAGGATVQTTGSISRSIRYYNGGYYSDNPSALFWTNWVSTGSTYTTSSDYFTTYGTYSYSGSGTLLVEKKAKYVNISSISVSLWGGGAGGATFAPGGGGGGGGITTASGRSSSSNVNITVGAGGAGNAYGSSTDYTDSGGGVYALRGTPGAYKQGGASTKTDGSYYYGDLGGEDPNGYYIWSGGGGGAGGAGGGGYYGENGGPGSSGRGIGGPGTYWSLGLGEGAGSGPAADGSGNANAGTGGGGRGGYYLSGSAGKAGGSGYYSITYVGPAATTAT